MGVLTRFTHGCLRFAARGWPAELREDLARDWLAELAVLEREPGTAWRRLTFAVSLAATPRTYDEDGVPRSRLEWWHAPGPTARALAGLLLAGAFGCGLWVGAQMLLNSLLPIDLHSAQSYLWTAVVGVAVATVVTAGYFAVVGWWLGGRAVAGTQHVGIRARAGLVVAVLGVVLVASLAGGEIDPVGISLGIGTSLGVRAAGVLGWAVATFTVVVAASLRVATGRARRGWGWVMAGAPLAAALAAAASWLAGSATDAGGSALVPTVLFACWLLPWTVCAVSFGWVTSRPRSPAVAGIGPAAATAVEAVAGKPPAPPAGVPAEPSVPARGEARTWRLTTVQMVVAVAAVVAAVLWAIGLVRWQPMSEPAAGSWGENNTYWARELRWDAIVAVALAVVVCAGARQRASREVLLGGLAWLAVDIALDRADLSHGTVTLAVVAAAVALAGCYRGMAGRGALRRGGLFVVAAIATMLSGVSLLTESPTDSEPALNWGSAGASCALALVAIGAALRAAPRLSRVRYALGCLSGAVAASTPWLLRARYPHPTSTRMLLGLGFTALLALCVAVVAWRRPGTPGQWLRYPAVAAGTLLAFPMVFLPAVIAFMIINVGGVFTTLAGNPPINSADSDLVYAPPAVLASFVLGWLLVFGEPGRTGSGRTRKPVGPPR